MTETVRPPSREQLIHYLYEAAELEHNLMCTYLYAAFSLRSPDEAGLSPAEAAAVARWRREILDIAVQEMGHLTAVWNITAALGAAPRFGRGNFPLDPGALPAGVVVKLAPFGEAVLQHFIHLERPEGSTEPDGDGFAPEWNFTRGVRAPRLTPMATDYDTVGAFYDSLGKNLRAFVAHVGESAAFCGDPALQLSPAEVGIAGAKPVICLKTSLAAFTAIVEQGEGAPLHSRGSHYQRFLAIREELAALMAENPAFSPAHPAAQNPVLRPPLRREGRVWIENEEAAAAVDLANASYALMLRLLAYSYAVPRPAPEKTLAIDLALGLMRAMTPLAERAARLPAGPSNPGCNAGMSFSALRDAAPLPPGPSARRFFVERIDEIARAAALLGGTGDAREQTAARILGDLAQRAHRGFEAVAAAPAPAPTAAPVAPAPTAALAPVAAAAASSNDEPLPTTPPTPTVIDGVDHIEGKKLTLLYEGKKCIHARFCVTGAPKVFIANVQGPWIHPDAVETDALVEIAHACPSGAIRYHRKDGKHDEVPPPVNLLAIRERGPYAVRGDIRLDGRSINYRATLCRCGASKNKPYCDGSHNTVGFTASGEPESGKTDMLEVRDGPLAVDPQLDGPLQVRGNLEITSGTGRVVARVQQANLCRCGGSNTKPFCDGTHARIGFRST
ncbi:MAG: ferritin-like domain-containing protein [Minicystis sp.]